MRAPFVFLAALSAPIVMAVACGGAIAPDGGGGNPEPTATSTGTPTTTTTPTTTPTSTGTTEPPPGPTCNETRDRIVLSVDGAGHADACGDMKMPDPTIEYDVVGQVVVTHPQDLEIETCPPTADCTSDTRVDVHVAAPELDLDLVPVGSFVTAHVSFAMSWSCVSSVIVRSLATWGGMKNPVDGGDHLYLEAVDGVLEPVGTALKVATVAQHCKPAGTPSCGMLTPDDYALQIFTGVGEGDGPIVHMGESRWPVFMPDGGTLRVHDVRSFESGYCDDEWNWAWWAIRDVAMPD